MAEPQEQEYRRIAQIFCAGYNREHNSSYRFSAINLEADETDLALVDGQRQFLRIQHTRCEFFSDFHKNSKLSILLTNELSNQLQDHGFLNCVVIITFSRSPKTRAEVRRVVTKLLGLILTLVQHGKIRRRLDRHELRQFEKNLHEVSSLEIQPGTTRKPLVFPDYEDRTEVRPQGGRGKDLIRTVTSKSKKYGSRAKDLVLLVETLPHPPDEYDVQCATKGLTTEPPDFREVWAVNRADCGFCARLWPLPSTGK
jgi:hypothetical protein